MNQKKLKEIANLLYQTSLVQLELQEQNNMDGISELRYVYHGLGVELGSTIQGEENEFWRKMVENRICTAVGDANYAKNFMESAKRSE